MVRTKSLKKPSLDKRTLKVFMDRRAFKSFIDK